MGWGKSGGGGESWRETGESGVREEGERREECLRETRGERGVKRGWGREGGRQREKGKGGGREKDKVSDSLS